MTCLLCIGGRGHRVTSRCALPFVFGTELNVWCDLHFSALHPFIWGANCFIKCATRFIFVRTALPIFHNNDNIVPYEAHCTLLLCLTVWTTSRNVALLKHAVAHFSGRRAPQRTLARFSLSLTLSSQVFWILSLICTSASAFVLVLDRERYLAQPQPFLPFPYKETRPLLRVSETNQPRRR